MGHFVLHCSIAQSSGGSDSTPQCSGGSTPQGSGDSTPQCSGDRTLQGTGDSTP